MFSGTSQDKGRQSSAGKFFGRRHHKDKDKPGNETHLSTQSPPGSAHGSQSSRHSHRHSSSVASVDRPLSLGPEQGLAMQAGVYSSIPVPSFEQNSNAPRLVDSYAAPQPHHLDKGG